MRPDAWRTAKRRGVNNASTVAKVRLMARSKRVLGKTLRSRTSQQRDVERARIIIYLAAKLSVSEVARKLGIDKKTVRRWRDRFIKSGPDGLNDAPRSGRPRIYSDEAVANLHKHACRLADDDGHLTHKRLAKETGMSPAQAGRLLKAAMLKPWLVKEWKHSPDPEFHIKVKRICRVYRKCPENTVVFSVDEKTAIQALERVHATRPCGRGRVARRAFEYKRHGVTNLFAALNVHTGQVYSMLADRKRGCEFIAFLKILDESVESGIRIVLVLDNIKTHDSKEVRKWLRDECPDRFQMLFTPKYASWVNQVEMFFSALSRRLLRRNSFPTLADLEARITDYIDRHNERAGPYKWSFTGWKWANREVGQDF